MRWLTNSEQSGKKSVEEYVASEVWLYDVVDEVVERLETARVK